LIFGIIVISILTGIFIWRNNNLEEIPNSNKESYTTPISAKYIPKNADLVFHWNINPKKIPDYIENSQGRVNKSITNKNTRLIRDSFFKLISLDFENNISQWAGDCGSFAILDSNNSKFNGWLMVLEINKNLTSQEALELIEKEKSIDKEIDSRDQLNISKSKVISKNINSTQSIYFLNDKNYILISSNPKIIKSSVDKLSLNKLNTKEKYKDNKLKHDLKNGFLLLETSTNKIFSLIGQKEDLLELNDANRLISSINIDNNQLIIEGMLSFDIKNKNLKSDLRYDLVDQEKEYKSFNDYLLIDNPQRFFETNSNHPIEKIIASLVQKSTEENDSNLLKIILKNTKGNLIWLKDKEWLVITKKSDTNKKEINNILNKDRFLNSSVDFANKNLEIWSKFNTIEKEGLEIKEKVAGILQENEDVYVWGPTLSSISNLNNYKYLEKNIKVEEKELGLNDFKDVIRIHLDKEKTKIFLSSFYPYILFQSMIGNQLNSPQNIDISLAIPSINYPDFVKFKINIKPS
tara:strand:- start:589 stop:2151 length:1563 start_codon:yes stop_codon:yes gene_type:complete